MDTVVNMIGMLFSSPFSGTFFQLATENVDEKPLFRIFVPFLGDFFSIIYKLRNHKYAQ